MWLFNTARMEEESATETARMDAERASETADTKARLYGLILSDGSLGAMDPEEPSFFISLIQAANRHQGRVREISLGQLRKSVQYATGD